MRIELASLALVLGVAGMLITAHVRMSNRPGLDHDPALVGRMRMNSGDYRMGVIWLKEAAAESPGDPVIQADLGLCYFELGDLPRAADSMMRAAPFLTAFDDADSRYLEVAGALAEDGLLSWGGRRAGEN